MFKRIKMTSDVCALCICTYFILAVLAPEPQSTLASVIHAATETGGAIITQVDDAEVRGNVTCLASEPAFAVAHKVIQFVLAFVAVTQVWITVVSDYKDTYEHISVPMSCV